MVPPDSDDDDDNDDSNKVKQGEDTTCDGDDDSEDDGTAESDEYANGGNRDWMFVDITYLISLYDMCHGANGLWFYHVRPPGVYGRDAC